MLDYLLSEAALAVCLGSVFQEALHWYNIRTRLHLKTTQRLMRSPLYWGTIAAMIGLSVFGVYFWFDGQPDTASLRDLFVFGAALPLIFKSVLKSVAADPSVDLGPASPPERDASGRRVLAAYFGV
ncbi:MAG: hypothetical protein AAF919_06975 [Pseudomonadota bacterium]